MKYESFREKAQERLDISQRDYGQYRSLERQQATVLNDVEQMSMRAFNKRKKGSPRIEKTIIEELGFLSMNGLQFHISIDDKGRIDRDGRDDIELLISTNPGEPLKPLRKIASGGELSRIMLAIKKVIGGEEEKALIFDEVDAGIGGRVAEWWEKTQRPVGEAPDPVHYPSSPDSGLRRQAFSRGKTGHLRPDPNGHTGVDPGRARGRTGPDAGRSHNHGHNN